jgi:transcriptional regulator with XRE-family HTH domain
MLRKPTKPFGTLLRELRQRVGLSQEELAAYLNLKHAIIDFTHANIDSIETGEIAPLHYVGFYKQLLAVPGVSESDITLLREAAKYELTWWDQDSTRRVKERIADLEQAHVPEIVQEYRKLSYWRVSPLIVISYKIEDLSKPVQEETSENLTESLQNDDTIPLLDPEKGADSAQYPLKTENPIPIHYPHRSVPDHAPQLVKEGKWEQAPKKGVVFEARHANLLFEALENPDHEHRQAAERAVHRFAREVEKPQGISINSAAQEFNVPLNFLWRWAKERHVIPIVWEGRGIGSATYLDWEKTQEVAEIYHEAKRQRKQPKKLLEEKYPESSKDSPK